MNLLWADNFSEFITNSRNHTPKVNSIIKGYDKVSTIRFQYPNRFINGISKRNVLNNIKQLGPKEKSSLIHTSPKSELKVHPILNLGQGAIRLVEN